jgi:hypothetical protein
MKQHSLFGDNAGAAGSRAVTALGVIGSSKTLTKAQKQFNKLIERLSAQRQELARWQAFREAHHRQVAAEYQPLAARFREKRIALVALLDRAMDGKELGKRQCDKVRAILLGILRDLLVEWEEPELVSLYDKYAPSTFEDVKDDEFEVMRAAASEAFGVDLDDVEGVNSPEDLTAWMDEQLAERKQRSGHGHRSQRPRHARAAADEVQRAKVAKSAEEGSRSLREVFRGLASRLHPDRETDALERARKTELMKEVNQAYKAGDLLRLLELQLAVEQINLRDLSALADERLRRYVTVLEQQSRRLDEELLALIEPFAAAVEGLRPRTLTPDVVDVALNVDIGELRATLRRLERDLERFRDVRELKRSLQDYRIERDDEDFMEFVPVRHRRRCGR